MIMRTSRLFPRIALVLATSAAALFTSSSCGTPNVTLTLNVPSNLIGSAKWLELGVLPGGCLTP